MNFEELGATLKAEREKRNLDINDVAAQLKISARQLRALEAGDMGAMPHPAYAKGFLRSYAAWLGLGNEEIQAALTNVQGTPLKKNAADNELLLPEGEPSQPRKSRGIYFLLVLCILAAAGYFAWKEGVLDFLDMDQNRKTDMASEIPTADNYMAAKDAENAKKNIEAERQKPEEPAAEGVLPIGGLKTGVEDIRPQQEPEKVEPEPVQAARTEQAPPVEEAAPAATPAEPEPSQHKLIITATEECWIHSNADKTDTRQFSLRKGDTFALTFAKSLELKLGNAGGVRLRYDGNDLPPPGTSGQVKTIVFPPKEN